MEWWDVPRPPPGPPITIGNCNFNNKTKLAKAKKVKKKLKKLKTNRSQHLPSSCLSSLASSGKRKLNQLFNECHKDSVLRRPKVLDCVRFGSQKCECHRDSGLGRPKVLYCLRFGPQTGDCHKDSGTQEQNPCDIHAILHRTMVKDIPSTWWGRCWHLLAFTFLADV